MPLVPSGVPAEGTPNIANNVAGGLRAPVPGRTDHLPISVPQGAYILPADIVSSLGQGNTEAGIKAIDQFFTSMVGPAQPGLAPAPPIDIAAAGGEYVVPPEAVKAIGHGDMNAGHAVLDAFVKLVRRNTVKHLSSLPGPKT